jgi:hypothetical protein
MHAPFLQQGRTERPATHRKAGSSLVRRLVEAQNDPAKHRIRAWLSNLNNEQLSSLGLTPEDMAVLRDTQMPSSSRREQRPNKTTGLAALPLAIGHSGPSNQRVPNGTKENQD